jgi:hypothetical protein
MVEHEKADRRGQVLRGTIAIDRGDKRRRRHEVVTDSRRAP